MHIATLFLMMIFLAGSLCWRSFTGLMYRKPSLQVVFGLLIIFFGMQAKHNAQSLSTLHMLGLYEFMPRIAEFMDAAFIPVGSGIIISGLILKGQMLNNVEFNRARKRLPCVVDEYREVVAAYESFCLRTDTSTEDGESRFKRFSVREKSLRKEIKKLVKILGDNGDEPLEKDFVFYF